MAVSCRRSSARPAVKERGPALCPCLLLSGLLRLGQHDQRAGQFIGTECVSPGGDDQLAELPDFAGLQPARPIVERLQFRVKVS